MLGKDASLCSTSCASNSFSPQSRMGPCTVGLQCPLGSDLARFTLSGDNLSSWPITPGTVG